MKIEKAIEKMQLENTLLGTIYVELLIFLEAIRKKDYETASEKAVIISEAANTLAEE